MVHIKKKKILKKNHFFLKEYSALRVFTVRQVIKNGHMYKLPSFPIVCTEYHDKGVCVCVHV